ncbi:hypothetical protein D9Q98_005666 [Chlorella vulgaris]|uniref:Uncharacterized protein n=1 Tax=Chlorella vulgaris TaxID=3077 RepID=A0A9D4YWC4_CHLVU|nr:hypothetical protein D9Q98_005666 [Chlorella vulgaris]
MSSEERCMEEPAKAASDSDAQREDPGSTVKARLASRPVPGRTAWQEVPAGSGQWGIVLTTPVVNLKRLFLPIIVLEHAFKFSDTSWVVTVELPAAGAVPHSAGSASGGQSSAGWRVHVYRRRGGRVEANLRLPGSFLRDYQVAVGDVFVVKRLAEEHVRLELWRSASQEARAFAAALAEPGSKGASKQTHADASSDDESEEEGSEVGEEGTDDVEEEEEEEEEKEEEEKGAEDTGAEGQHWHGQNLSRQRQRSHQPRWMQYPADKPQYCIAVGNTHLKHKLITMPVWLCKAGFLNSATGGHVSVASAAKASSSSGAVQAPTKWRVVHSDRHRLRIPADYISTHQASRAGHQHAAPVNTGTACPSLRITTAGQGSIRPAGWLAALYPQTITLISSCPYLLQLQEGDVLAFSMQASGSLKCTIWRHSSLAALQFKVYEAKQPTPHAHAAAAARSGTPFAGSRPASPTSSGATDSAAPATAQQQSRKRRRAGGGSDGSAARERQQQQSPAASPGVACDDNLRRVLAPAPEAQVLEKEEAQHRQQQQKQSTVTQAQQQSPVQAPQAQPRVTLGQGTASGPGTAAAASPQCSTPLAAAAEDSSAAVEETAEDAGRYWSDVAELLALVQVQGHASQKLVDAFIGTLVKCGPRDRRQHFDAVRQAVHQQEWEVACECMLSCGVLQE